MAFFPLPSASNILTHTQALNTYENEDEQYFRFNDLCTKFWERRAFYVYGFPFFTSCGVGNGKRSFVRLACLLFTSPVLFCVLIIQFHVIIYNAVLWLFEIIIMTLIYLFFFLGKCGFILLNGIFFLRKAKFLGTHGRKRIKKVSVPPLKSFSASLCTFGS